jgi:cysteine desulfurase
LPNNINISIPGISGERLVIELDARGICASSKSACKEDDDEESHVIAAIRSQETEDRSRAVEGSLRFSMGRNTSKEEIQKAVAELVKIVTKIKKFSLEVH